MNTSASLTGITVTAGTIVANDWILTDEGSVFVVNRTMKTTDKIIVLNRKDESMTLDQSAQVTKLVR